MLEKEKQYVWVNILFWWKIFAAGNGDAGGRVKRTPELLSDAIQFQERRSNNNNIRTEHKRTALVLWESVYN